MQLSDEPLLDQMVSELADDKFRIGRAIELIVMSPQFRQIRGREFHDAFAEE